MLTLYEVHEESIRRGAEQLCLDLWDKGWWDSYQSVVDMQAIDRAWLESTASSIRWFEGRHVPALLQTEDYASAAIVAADPLVPESVVKHAVEFTLRRQDDIVVGDRPRHLSVVIDESVLHRVVGSRAILRDQLIRLLNLSTVSHIDLRVLPFSAGTPDLPASPFTVLTMPSPFPYSEVALVDTWAGPVEFHGPTSRELAGIHDGLATRVACLDESRVLIQARVDQLL